MTPNQLRNKIQEMKKERGITYIHICRNCGIAPSTLTNFMKGRRELSAETLFKIYNYIKEN